MRQGQAKMLSADELKRVYAVVQSGNHSKRNVVLLDFSFLLGLRVKEIASLRISDLVDGNGKIVDSFFLTPDQSKGDRGRTIYLTNKKLRKHLKEYLDERNDCNPMLIKSQKGKFSPNSLQQLFKRIYRQAGISGAKSHSGRRYFVTKLIEAGYDIRSISILCGHRSVVTTSKYFCENPVKLGEMVAGL